MPSLSSLKPHALLTQGLNFLLVLSTAFMLWKGLSVAADSKSPIVVVLSGSMEPAFQRGDLLFLWNRDGLLPRCWGCEFAPWIFPHQQQPQALTASAGVGYTEHKDVRVGEIVVYEVRGKDIPIVHRVVRRYPAAVGYATSKRLASGAQAGAGTAGTGGGIRVLTKGDNNAADDVELYAKGQSLLDRDRDVIGSVVGFVPYVGYGTILLSEYPWLKTVMLGLMGVTVVLQRE